MEPQIVLAVGVELAHHWLAELLGNAADHRAGHAIQQQRRFDHPQVFHQQARGLLIPGQVHVQRTVAGLDDVLQPDALRPGNLA